MGEVTPLMARDGHEFQAYLAAPRGAPRAAVVVVQEIFGVNRHIRAVTDGYAAEGYVAIAPALFDRVRRGVELGYGEADRNEGFGYRQQVKDEHALADIAASIAVVRHAGRVAVVGYCWGGLLAWLAARELPIACAVSYYGGRIAKYLDRVPRKPVMYHFGERDAHIPPAEVEQIRAAHPAGIFHLYPAGHGFNCTDRPDYDAASAALSLQRSLAFIAEHAG
ncbi:MAG: dienelactone hydrolase family protein [Steroidobacteraceae bacterium]